MAGEAGTAPDNRSFLDGSLLDFRVGIVKPSAD